MYPIHEKLNAEHLYASMYRWAALYPDMKTFAFLVYDAKDHLLRRILDDPIYWEALNEISGRYLHLFYLELPPHLRRSFSVAPGRMERMVPIARAGDHPDLDGIVRMLRLLFNEPIKSPAIFFFRVEGNSITDHFAVHIKKSETEAAFNELREVIEQAVALLEKEANAGGAYFDRLQDAVRLNRLFRFIKSHLSFQLGPFSCRL